MATVRKRAWQTASGETKAAWVADYSDQDGKRHLKTFSTKKAADAWLVTARHEVHTGVHTPENASLTVAEAGELWIGRGEGDGLERSTLAKYPNHLDLHIRPSLGGIKLARLSRPALEKFRDDLVSRLSLAMARKVLGSLKSLLNDAQRRGLVAQNTAQQIKIDARKRDKKKLVVGRDIPGKPEIRAMIEVSGGRWRPLLLTAAFTGLRASELRGLTWDDLDFEKKVVHVRQRADQWGVIGSPKSEAGHRTIPMSPMVTNALREWKLICPRLEGRLGLVFPNGKGRPESHANIIKRGFEPIQLDAQVAQAHATKKDGRGMPVLVAKYGMHALRHFFASWAIEQGFSPKKLQSLLGHSSIQMTFDTYGHLFPSLEDDHAKFAAAESAMLG